MHNSDVIMSPMPSQITSLTIVYSIVYSGTDQIKYQSSALLAFVRGIHRRPVNSPHKWPVTREMFPFDDVIMGSCLHNNMNFIKPFWKLLVCWVELPLKTATFGTSYNLLYYSVRVTCIVITATRDERHITGTSEYMRKEILRLILYNLMQLWLSTSIIALYANKLLFILLINTEIQSISFIPHDWPSCHGPDVDVPNLMDELPETCDDVSNSVFINMTCKMSSDQWWLVIARRHVA